MITHHILSTRGADKIEFKTIVIGKLFQRMLIKKAVNPLLRQFTTVFIRLRRTKNRL